MSDAAVVSNQAGAGKLGFVSRLDVELESAWRERRWGSFIRAWVTTVVLAGAAGFLLPLVMIGIYLIISMLVFRAEGKGAPTILSTCTSIGALAGSVALIFTIPIMALKSLQGGPAPRRDTA